MSFQLFDFETEAKYSFSGYYYGRSAGEHETFKKKMTIPSAIELLGDFIFFDTSVSVLGAGHGFEESLSLISDHGCIYIECATTSVLSKIAIRIGSRVSFVMPKWESEKLCIE